MHEEKLPVAQLTSSAARGYPFLPQLLAMGEGSERLSSFNRPDASLEDCITTDPIRDSREHERAKLL